MDKGFSVGKVEGPEIVRDSDGFLVWEDRKGDGAVLASGFKALGWTAKGFAKVAGVDERTARRWLKGKSPAPKWAFWLVGQSLWIRRLSKEFDLREGLPGQKRRPKGAGK